MWNGPQVREVMRQVGHEELVDALGPVEVLQSVLAEVFEGNVGQDVVGEDRVRRAREENLATVAGRADPGGAMNGQSDVSISRRGRFTRVETHSHSQVHIGWPGTVCERALSCQCRGDCILRTREDGQEGVALCVDLAPARVGERIAKEPLVFGEHRAVLLPEPGQESRRSLDVREEERDGAARELRPRNGALCPSVAVRDRVQHLVVRVVVHVP